MFDALDVRSICLIREALARHSGLADFVFAMQGLGSGAVALAGSLELQDELLPRVAAGTAIAGFALTEARSGSDVANLETEAVRVGDEYRINGGKTFISNAGLADFYTLFARTGEGSGARGISAFVVDGGAPGLTVSERIRVMSPHPLGTLQFHEMPVAASRMLGSPGEGFKIAMRTLDVFRTSVGAAALGFARRALDEALGRVTQRQLFGKPLCDQPVVQAALADMALAIDASALLVYRSSWTRDTTESPTTMEAAMAKMYATEAAQTVIDTALQMHGGLGVVHGTPVESLYREIRALRIYEGATEVQRVVIARQLLNRDRATRKARAGTNCEAEGNAASGTCT
jgi:acyl-CoA dehydrogenase